MLGKGSEHDVSYLNNGLSMRDAKVLQVVDQDVKVVPKESFSETVAI